MHGSVAGYVVEADSGRPAQDVSVFIASGPGPAPDIAALTDAEGHFRLDHLQPGLWNLRAVGPAGAEATGQVEVFENAVSEATISLGGE
jgi:hypothetical protein